MSGECFGRFVCYLAVKYVTLKIKIIQKKLNILSSDIKYKMLFGVTVQTIYLLGGNNKFCKKNIKVYLCYRRYETTLL